MRGIGTGDWHLNALAKHFDDSIVRQMHEIDKMYKYAVAQGIDHIFVNGDVSNTPILSSDAYIALYALLMRYDGVVNTHYIAGNHDFSEVGKTSLDFLKVLVDNNVFKTFHIYLEPEQRKIDDTYVNFCPYPQLESLECKRPALNMAHVEYNGALGDNGRKLRVKSEKEFTQADLDFTISGHIHQYQFLESKRAVYAGSPYQMNFGESLPKGFIDFETVSKKQELRFNHEFINLQPDFTLQQLVIKRTRDLEQLTNSDAVRYKLWVGEKVRIPDNLMARFPNITGGIFDLETKQKSETIEVQKVERHTFDLTKNLKKFLKNQGHDKSQIKDAMAIVAEAMTDLGIAKNF